MLRSVNVYKSLLTSTLKQCRTFCRTRTIVYKSIEFVSSCTLVKLSFLLYSNNDTKQNFDDG